MADKSKHPRLLPSFSPNPTINNNNNNNNPIDSVLELFLALPDASSASLDISFDRLLETRSADYDRNYLIQRALTLGSILVEAGNRSVRKRNFLHNAAVWYLPFDLTVKVFSILDTRSVCYAAATCSLFNKCAADPACYVDIDMTGMIPKVDDVVVSTMIQRGGTSLRSLKLGIVDAATTLFESPMSLDCSGRKSKDCSNNDAFRYYRPEERSFLLTKSCLVPLSVDGGSIGALLTRLHLYQINNMDNTSLCTALSSCPSLTDLGIVSLRFDLCQALETVSKCCPLLEHLYLDSSRTVRSILRPPTSADLVKNCPRIYSLALRGFELDDSTACVLVKGFRKLKFLDLSTSYTITGSFLKDIDGSSGGNFLEVLVLRDFLFPEQMEVARFLSAVISGEFECLRYLDISNHQSFDPEDELNRPICDTISIGVAQLLEKRPGIVLLAEFPHIDEYVPEVDIYEPDFRC